MAFIEPFAALLRDVLGAETMRKVELHEARIQDVNLELYAELCRNDVLFIDSTHVMKTGSDVCHELFSILPRLAPGALIHFHDIFWPFEYGDEWVLTDAFEILFFNGYFRRFSFDLISDTYPNFLKNRGGSLWLRKLDTSKNRCFLAGEEEEFGCGGSREFRQSVPPARPDHLGGVL